MHDKHYCLSCFFFIFRTQTASSNSKEGIFTVCRPSNTTLVSNYRSKQCLLKPDDSFSSCKCEFLKLTNQFLECKDHRKHWIGSWKNSKSIVSQKKIYVSQKKRKEWHKEARPSCRLKSGLVLLGTVTFSLASGENHVVKASYNLATSGQQNRRPGRWKNSFILSSTALAREEQEEGSCLKLAISLQDI